MDPAHDFAALVRSADPSLDRGVLLISACAGRAIDVGAQLARFDDLARGCPEATLDGIRAYLFEELGFRGNTEQYADPENSFLDAVLDRRLGIPITLSVVLMEVGRRVGLHLGAVGMPGHFLVRSLNDPELFIDAFHGGRLLGEPECRAVYEELHATPPFDPRFLDVVDSRTVLWRMLSNLRQAYGRQSDLQGLRWLLPLQLAFPEPAPAERRQIAVTLGMVGALDAAASELDRVADDLPDDDAEAARRQAAVLRARLN